VSLRVLVLVFAAGLLTWAVSDAQSPVARATRGLRVHSEASASLSSTAPASPAGLQVQPGAALQVRLSRLIGDDGQHRLDDLFKATSGVAAGLKAALVTGRMRVSIPAQTLLTFRLCERVSEPLTAEGSAQVRRQEF